MIFHHHNSCRYQYNYGYMSVLYVLQCCCATQIYYICSSFRVISINLYLEVVKYLTKMAKLLGYL